MSVKVVEPKRELPNAPMFLALFIICVLIASVLTLAVKAIDTETAQLAQRRKAETVALAAQAEQPYDNPMAKRIQKAE